MAVNNGFFKRYSAAFGKSQALILRLAGFDGAEATASGPYIFDSTGKRWLDFGSFGIHLLGHCHPEIVHAARYQMSRMGLSGKILGNAAAMECAESILARTAACLDKVVFANTGSEAVEIALKLSLLRDGRTELISLTNAYHGKTIGAFSVTAHDGCEQLQLCSPVHFVDPSQPETAAELIRSDRIAAVIAEPIQGEGGILPVATEFWQMIGSMCPAHDVLIIVDEIQTGLGRCGQVWKSTTLECQPDILLMGKTLGGGMMPVAAVAYTSEKMKTQSLDPEWHASSFAGGPLACTVAQRALELVCDEDFLNGVRSRGHLCRERLLSRWLGNPAVRAIRGEGLMLGIEFESPGFTSRVIMEAAKMGLLVTFCLRRPTVLRFYPPAVISIPDLERGLSILCDAVELASETTAIDTAAP